MHVVDTNVLLYAVNEDSPRQAAARTWLEQAVSAGEALGLPWVTMLGFIRIATHRSWSPNPLSLKEASAFLEALCEPPTVVVVDPAPSHLRTLRGLLDTAGTAGNLTTDAHIAALALELRAGVVSFDRDFERFGVSVTVPA